jgi:hypothetical protein
MTLACKHFGLRREAERHAALEALPAVEKRCRRFALPAHSKNQRQRLRHFSPSVDLKYAPQR